MKHLSTAVLAAALLVGATSVAKADISVATVGPMTGQYAAFGEQMKRGAEMAVAHLNAKGGVLGQKVKLEVGDDACDPKQAVAVANQMAGKKVAFIAGHFCSSSSIPASKVYAEENVLQMSPASTNPTLTDQGLPNVFRTCGRDDQQGTVAGNYIATNFKGKKVAVLHDKSAYGKGLADETKKALNAAGVTEDMYEAYTAGEKDYSALVSKLKGAGIDVIYLGGYHTEGGLLIRQAHEQGYKPQLISGDALVTAEFGTIAGAASEGTLMTFQPDPRKKDQAKALVEEFKKSGYDPEGYTLYTYAAIQVWAAAVEQTKGTDTMKVAKAIKAGSFDTVLGKLSFDAKGDVKNAEYVWYIWKGGNYGEM